jgi:hypothetical protein
VNCNDYNGSMIAFAGLFSRHRGQEPSTLTPELKAIILEWTVKRKPRATTHWSTRKLAGRNSDCRT